MQWTIDETKRLNSRKETLGPAPLWIQFGGAKSQIMRNEILKAAKKLKQSVKFKNISISPDLSVQQRIKLKELNSIKKELNEELKNSLFKVDYYYGIRDNKIVKLKKEVNVDTDTSKIKNRLKDLTEELIRHKEIVNDSINKLATTIDKFMPMIEMLNTSQNNYTQCCIAHNRKSHDNLIQSSLVSCFFIKSIYNELSKPMIQNQN